jgi:hypothetical protein
MSDGGPKRWYLWITKRAGAMEVRLAALRVLNIEGV